MKISQLILLIVITIGNFSTILISDPSQEKPVEEVIQKPQISQSDSISLIWNTTWDSGYSGFARGVVVDSLGNIYTVGQYDKDPGIPFDLWYELVKFDADGTYQWNRTLGKIVLDERFSIAIDSADMIYVLGQNYTGSDYNITLFKYDSLGDQKWNSSWGGFENDGAYGLTLDTQGNIYVAGYTRSFPIFGSQDLVLLKFNNSGSLNQSKIIGLPSNFDAAYDVAVDEKGDIFLISENSTCMHIFRFNNELIQTWNETWAPDNSETYPKKLLLKDENLFIVGYNGTSPSDTFLLKYDKEGINKWKTFEDFGSVNSYGYDIAIDKCGNFYIPGRIFRGAFINNLTLLKINSEGNITWSLEMGDVNHQTARGIWIDNDNDKLYVVGSDDGKFLVMKFDVNYFTEDANDDDDDDDDDLATEAIPGLQIHLILILTLIGVIGLLYLTLKKKFMGFKGKI